MTNFTKTLRRWAIRLPLVSAMALIAVASWVKLTSRPQHRETLSTNIVSHGISERVGGMETSPANSYRAKYASK